MNKFRNCGLIAFFLLGSWTLYSCINLPAPPSYELLKDGDLIFQTSKSDQSQAIQLATDSKYSHCGILFKEKNEWYVFEASNVVKKTRLKDWIDNGVDHKYAVKRLKDADQILTTTVLEKMKSVSLRFANRPYDGHFEWSDEKIYCSELIWKIYHETLGIELGTLRKLKDFDLSHPQVKEIMQLRYHGKVPLEEPVIAPSDIFDCDLLQNVN
jgi:hypothetical protein